MAGRKSTNKADFFSLLLSKLGMAEAPPEPKRRRRRQPRPTEPYVAPPQSFDESLLEESPFAGFGAQAGLMDEGPAQRDLRDEQAAAAGYAPLPKPAAPASAPFPTGAGDLPGASGRLFQEDGLDSSLDALFSGLEAGFAGPPIPPTPASLPPDPQAHGPQTHPTPAAPAPGSSRVIHTPIVAATPVEVPSTPNAPAAAASQVAVPASVLAGASLSAQGSAPLPLSRGVDLTALLINTTAQKGVAGALLVGYDGLLIAAQVPREVDAERLGAQAGTLFSENSQQLVKLQRGELRRMMLETASGAMLVTAADMGILVVVSRDRQTMDLTGVLAAIGDALGAAQAS
ncbi:MAG: roadblock/LC7 domain-containing protein [Candidatus Sericytochromatia bacterium]|nr:roadblock/LC7 domain-containing protein [Candidatus Sericytochromatia bacterium]